MQLALSTKKLGQAEASTKPDGGYFSLLAEQCLMLLWLIREKSLTVVALRVYLGLIELRGERFVHWLEVRAELDAWKKTKQGPPPRPLKAHYAILPELERHTGLPRRKLMAAISELERLGLVTVSRERITFATRADSIPSIDFDEFDPWANSLGVSRKRQVPLGRRMLRFLASGADGSKNLAVLFGVVMGLSLRAAFYYAHSENPYRFAGWCRVDWLATLLGVSERTIQRLKDRLKRAGWFLPQPVSQWARNRYGERFLINPTWGSEVAPSDQVPEAAPAEAAKLTPGEGEARPELSPPPDGISAPTVTPIESNKESPNGTKNQDNESLAGEKNSGPDFFQSQSEQRKTQPPSELSPPRLSDIKPRLDFVVSGIARLLELFRQAVKCGLIDGSEASRLRWVAAAVRSMIQPDVKNPAGIFLKITKGRLWGHLSDDDFDEANRRLKAHFFGGSSPAVAIVLPFPSQPFEKPEPSSGRPKLSKDALLLQVINNRGVKPEAAFPALREQGWDRRRFVAAQQELLASGR